MKHFLTTKEIEDILNDPVVQLNKQKLLTTNKVNFSIQRTELKTKLKELSINVYDINSIKKNQDLIEFIPDRNTKRLLREVIKTNNLTLITNLEKTQKIIDQMYFNFFKRRMKGKYSTIFNEIINLLFYKYKNNVNTEL